MLDFKDKIAVITGASRSIGRGIALAFAREGCTVVINYSKSREEAEEVVNKIKEMGIVASGNADWPICSANVFEGIHVCVNRTSETGQDLGQNQAISVMDAIKVYTWNGAYITFEEDIKGSIEEGKLADIVILDTDILTCDPSEIVNTKVLTTILDGKLVYQRD